MGSKVENPHDVLARYCNEALGHPLLTLEEVKVLYKTISLGKGTEDPELIAQAKQARNELTRCNLKLVVGIAKKHQGKGVPLTDLIQEGNLGLMTAIDKFNPELGYQFSTYANWWIRQAVTRAIPCQGRTIRLPIDIYDALGTIYRASGTFEEKTGGKPTEEEMAETTGLALKKIKLILGVVEEPISLQQPVGNDGDTEFGDFVKDNLPSLDELVQQVSLSEKIEELLRVLEPNEEMILRLHFGLDGGKSCTLKEIGRRLGVTRQRISQIKAGAMRKLRQLDKSAELKIFLEEERN